MDEAGFDLEDEGGGILLDEEGQAGFGDGRPDYDLIQFP